MSKFDESKENGYHKFLADLCGNWSGKVRTWFEEGKLGQDENVTATIQSILEGRFALLNYKSIMMDKPQEGMMIIGSSLNEQKLQTAWTDTFHNHTTIMVSDGEQKDGVYNVFGTFPGESPTDRWGWRTIIELKSADNLLITMNMQFPDGTEVKAVEFDFNKV